MTTYTVFGIFENHDDAETAINKLEEKGYNPKDISIVAKDRKSGENVEKHTGTKVTGGVVSGITTGAVVGGIAGLVASFIIPGLGAFFIGGPIAAALGLTGAAATTVSGAATGALAGGIVGALTGFGLSEKDARTYEKRINEGAMLIAVPARADEEDVVEMILENAHAENVRSVVLHEQDRGESSYSESTRQRDTEYEEQSHQYAGAKGGRTKSSAKSKTSEGKGWHGDPGGHAKAGKGEAVKKKRH